MMEQLQQICAQRGIRIVDSSATLPADNALYSGRLRVLFIGRGLTEKSVNKIIELLEEGVPA